MDTCNINEPNRKTFFDLLQPKQAFVLGCISTLLMMGTLGFILLGAYVLQGGAEGGRLVAEGVGGGDSNAEDTGKDNEADPLVPVVPEPATGEVPGITESDHVVGNAKAPLTLIEYSDFQCPFCSRFHPTVKQVLEEYPNDVKVVYRHFPLSFHPNALPAAEASECAGEQGKFWEYADKLFENQSALGAELYIKLAADLGLNTDAFKTCLDSDKFLTHIQQDMQGGSSAGVSGTPGSFLIDADGNAQSIKGALPYSTVKSIIDQAL